MVGGGGCVVVVVGNKTMNRIYKVAEKHAFRGASAASDEKCEARAFEERAQRATRMRVRGCSVFGKHPPKHACFL